MSYNILSSFVYIQFDFHVTHYVTLPYNRKINMQKIQIIIDY